MNSAVAETQQEAEVNEMTLNKKERERANPPGQHVQRLVDHAIEIGEMLQGRIPFSVSSLVIRVEKMLEVRHCVVTILVERSQQFLQALLHLMGLQRKLNGVHTIRNKNV